MRYFSLVLLSHFFLEYPPSPATLSSVSLFLLKSMKRDALGTGLAWFRVAGDKVCRVKHEFRQFGADTRIAEAGLAIFRGFRGFRGKAESRVYGPLRARARVTRTDPSGSDDHGRRPVTSADRPRITARPLACHTPREAVGLHPSKMQIAPCAPEK